MLNRIPLRNSYIQGNVSKLYVTLQTYKSRYAAHSETLLILSLLVYRNVIAECKLPIITNFGITHQTKPKRIPSSRSINLERTETSSFALPTIQIR